MTRVDRLDQLSLIASESAVQFVGNVARIFLIYGLTIILTRNLGPNDYGLWTLTLSLQSIFMLFVLLGMPKALYRFIAYYQGSSEWGKTKSLIVETFFSSILLSIIITIILLIVPTSRLDGVFHEPGIGRLVHVTAFEIPFLALLTLISSCYIGFKKVRYQVFIETIGLPLVQMVIALLIFGKVNWEANVMTWAWAHVSTLFVISLTSLWLFRRKIWPSLQNVYRVPLEHAAIISYVWPLALNTVLILGASQIDFILLGLFGSARDIGVYRVYLYFVMPLQIVLASFARIYQPVVTELIAQRGLAEAASVFKRVARWTLQINLFIALSIIVLSEKLIPSLFGEEYWVVPITLSILVLGKCLDSSVGPTQMTLEAFGHAKLVLLNSILVVTLQIVGAYLLIPRFGLIGAAMARASATALTNYIELFEVWLLYRISPISRLYGWSLLIGIFVFSLSYLNRLWLSFASQWHNVLLTFLIGTVVYWGFTFLFGATDQEDRRVISGLVRQLRLKPIA